MEMTALAPAKVNWHLQVGEKRPDGFHEIVSVFQKINLCDILYISYKPSDSFSFFVKGLEGICKEGTSTLDKAAFLWHESTGINAEIKVNITKNIPSQAGLGGGSSDAASLLVSLERLSGYPTSPIKLINMAASVGSDVPFFIAGCDAAIVTGRGELISPIQARHDLCGYLLFPKDKKVSTAQAYEAIDSRPSFDGFVHEAELVSIYNRPVEKWNFENDFTLVNAKPDFKPIESKKKLLLTGSGSSWVLVSDSSFSPDCLSSFNGKTVSFTTALD